MKKKWLDYLIVYIGCVIQAFSIVCILKPNNLTVGGITGLSLTIGKLLNFNYTIICLISALDNAEQKLKSSKSCLFDLPEYHRSV